MALWGHTSGSESKPNWLSDADKQKTVAKPHGWELVRKVGSRTLTETLVAMKNLTTALGAANLTDIDWNITAFDKSEGGTLSVTATFNEDVTVTGTPQLSVANNGVGRGPHVLSYASGSGTNELVFTLVIAAANAATNAGDVLSIGANAIALNSGTIKDKGTNVASVITNIAGVGTAAGTITVVA
jgi:hypothetical protein